MATSGDKYITLMASMPALSTPFAAGELPMSRLGLEARLRLLDEDDAQELERIQQVMVWERIDISLPAPEIIRSVDAVMGSLNSETLRTVVRERFELRTVLAALRRRRRGEAAPPTGMAWGYGRHVDHIRRNWTRPHFGLRRAMPWLGEVRELHDVGSTLRLDQVISQVAWQGLITAQRAHEFDFDAVVLYVLRYDMIARWLGRSAEKARKRFDELVATGLGDYTAWATELA
jgi:hypothetical protein